MMKKLLGVILLLPALAWAQSAFEGTWKVNVQTAKLSEKPDTFVLQGGRYTCSTCIPKIDVKADGSDQKVPEAKGYDTVAVKEVNARTMQQTRKLKGQVVGEETDTLSADGKSMSVEFKDYPPQGAPVTGKVLLTRVSEGPKGANAVSGSWRASKVENVTENGLKVTFHATADGLQMSAPTGESYDAKFDGKDYPVKGDRAGGAVSLKKISANTIEETYKQDGKAVTVNQMTVQGK